MKITIRITRSATWLASQQLHRGENLPREIGCKVPIEQLSLAARRMLLSVDDNGTTPRYPGEFSGWYNKNYKWITHHGDCATGSIPLLIDADIPTTQQLDDALLVADAALYVKRIEHEENLRREAAEQTAKGVAADKLAAARELLKDELAQLAAVTKERDALKIRLRTIQSFQ